MPEWTTSQRQAIETRGKTLLVSAGAGSGKTTVLTQRIIERIREGASIGSFLVVTFTRASAQDLKNKLYDAISRLVSENPDNRQYRAQLYLLPSARISTIHSFCLEIVRANFQSLGLSPGVRMADEQETDLLAADVMETVIDAFYEEGDPDFLLLADTFSGTKDDEPLARTMLGLYGKLRAYTSYFGMLEAQAEQLESDAQTMSQGLFATHIGRQLQEKLTEWFDDLAKAADELYGYVTSAAESDKPLETAGFWREQTALLAAAAHHSYRLFTETARNFRTLVAPRISYGKMPAEAKRYYGAQRDRIKKETERLVEAFAVGSEAEFARQLSLCGRVVRAAVRFLSRFEELYAGAKRDKGVMDFSDAEHFLLQLLEKDGAPTPLCLSLRQQLTEICIDEYQDVSPLQDHIFTLLSAGDNRFMVGDVKQSIYRFRNAHPDIFLGYKEQFPALDNANGDSACIFLRENFRSGKNVLDFTNLLFANITRGTPYAREYSGEELVYARPLEDRRQPVTVAVAPYTGRTKSAGTALEAGYIAEEILRLVGSGSYPSPDGEKKYRYGDIVLLFRALKGATKPYEEALRARGIPFAVTTAEPFFDRPEILLAISLMRTVDDPSDDISLVATMRSPIGGFTAGELYELRQAHPDGVFFRAVQHAAEKEGEGELSARCRAFSEQLELFREQAEGTACHAFLWELYTRTGLLQLCTKREKTGLLMLYEYARSFESGGYKGLSGFLSYLRAAQEKGLELPGASEGDADRVTLTTIHRSKGLEYPAVFLCGCDRSLFGNFPKPYRLLRAEGLSFKLRDYEKLTVTDPLPNRFSALIERDAELGEELRKLYVACTRARERLYITGAISEKQLETGSFDNRSPQSLLELVLYATACQADPCYERIDISETEVGLHHADEIEREREQAGAEAFLTPETERAIRFRYPYADSGIPAKVSVSELKETLADAPLEPEYHIHAVTRAPSFLTNAEPGATERGTANHVFLQFCRFDAVEQNGIAHEAAALAARRILTPEQVSMLDEAGLRAFFASDLYKRMRKSKCFYREQRFSVRVPAVRLGGSVGETVLLQGVIDCFFEEADGSMTVVDYKTDRERDPAVLRQRHETQLQCYREAVEAMTGRRVGKTILWSFTLRREL